MSEWHDMQNEPNTKLRDLLITYKLGKKLTKVAWSNEKNMNHSLMEHLIILTINQTEHTHNIS